jgi:hypothetical protein
MWIAWGYYACHPCHAGTYIRPRTSVTPRRNSAVTPVVAGPHVVLAGAARKPQSRQKNLKKMAEKGRFMGIIKEQKGFIKY